MNTTETLTFNDCNVSNVGEIWTIGHSTRSTEEFLAMLHDHAIDLLVDVRSFPGSRRCPQFGRETMSTWLADDAITYQHTSDLGGRRNRQHDVDPAINGVAERELSELRRLHTGRRLPSRAGQLGRHGANVTRRVHVLGSASVEVSPLAHREHPRRTRLGCTPPHECWKGDRAPTRCLGAGAARRSRSGHLP